jgi:uncharacterized protein (TIGR02594 family)
MKNFFGTELIWFVGVVEDRNDPVQMGRVRVRCFGWHTDKKTEIPTEELPWAIVSSPTSGASVSGIGSTPSGLLEGAWVFGFFMDGKVAQEPMILGSIPGYPTKAADTSVGFNDPAGNFPRIINEPDVNRLARGTNTITYNLDSQVSEPASPYAAQYPFNHVMETESGHIKEYDDTPGAERIREKHRSGTLYEIHPTGDRVVRIVGNDYQIIAGAEKIHIQGSANIIVNQSVDMKVGGSMRIASGGTMTFIAPRIDLNPPGGTVGTVDPIITDSVAPYTLRVIPVSANDVPPDHPANSEVVETVPGEGAKAPTYEAKSTPPCAELTQFNPYDIAAQAYGLGESAWRETGSNSYIKALWDEIGYDGSRFADETAWCAVFVGAILKRSGNKYYQTASSQAYAKYGVEVSVDEIQQGDIIVFYRKGTSSGLGHVGFATGKQTATSIEVLGGNQRNTLNVSSFLKSNAAKGWGIRTVRRAVSCKDGTTEAPAATASASSATSTGGSVT